jgi:chitinase
VTYRVSCPKGLQHKGLHAVPSRERKLGERFKIGAAGISLAAITLSSQMMDVLAGGTPGRPCTFVAYLPSWSASAHETAIDLDISQLPDYVDVIQLAFMRPDASYSSQSGFSGTGLEFPYPVSVLKASIAALKARRPNVKVLASLGGETYSRWDKLNAQAIAGFVRDLELNGVDIDFEPAAANCRKEDGSVVCDSDATLVETISVLRSSLPSSALVSLTIPSVSAYGEGHWEYSRPYGGPNYGLALAVLRDRSLSAGIDYVSVMAYDAGPDYQPVEAYRAVRSFYAGPVLIGFTPPPEAWGSHVYSTVEAQTVLRSALAEGATGAMLFHLKKNAEGSATPERPDATLLGKALAATLSFCTNGPPS